MSGSRSESGPKGLSPNPVDRGYRGAVRLLILEDEEGLASALRIGLQREGYAVDIALTCAAAREQLTVWEYDVLLLDVNLPDGEGFSFAEEVRSGRLPSVSGADLRILMLTARSRLPDRVRGLDTGADDYLVKPFAIAELSARLRALLRRETRGTSSVVQVADVVLERVGKAPGAPT